MSRTLPPNRRVEYVARACRSALLDLARAPRRWNGRELVAWFDGPHATATAGSERRPLSPDDIPELSLAPDPLAAAVVQARDALIDLLLGGDGRSARARMVIGCIRDGIVVRLRDVEGREGWTPERLAGVPLVDHLRALAAADCLMRPQDYDTKLARCGQCDALGFGTCGCGTPRGKGPNDPIGTRIGSIGTERGSSLARALAPK